MLLQPLEPRPPLDALHRSAVVLAVFILVFVVVVSGCASGTKAGGESRSHTVVLTIADPDPGARDLGEYASAVERLSHGSLRLRVRSDWRGYEADYDRGTLEDVRTGRVDLAKIAVSSFDTFGVGDFQALMAPLLIDRLQLERKALASSLPGEMLRGVTRLRVEGIALLPGELVRPFGLVRRLVGPAQYRGAVVGIRPSVVASKAFRALGARPRAYAPTKLPPWRFRGADLDLVTADGGYSVFGHSSVTANVAFWPRAFAVVGNRKMLAQLTGEQRDVLQRAGPAALDPALARVRVEEAAATRSLCRARVAFVRASPVQLAQLRAALRPVYAELERNPRTRSRIVRIRALKRRMRAEVPPRCGRPGEAQRAPRTLLDGTWQMTASPAHVSAEAAGSPTDIDAGRYRMSIRNGRWSLVHVAPRWTESGTFAADGDTVTWRSANGNVTHLRWNIYRDTLVLERAPGEPKTVASVTYAPWHRVGR